MFASFVAFAVMAVPQGKAMPNSYVGIWSDTEDHTYMVGSPSYVEYISGDQWGVIHGVYQAPNGDFVGSWLQSKTLYGGSPGSWSLVETGSRVWPDTITSQYQGFGSKVISPLRPDNVRYAGEFRMSLVANGGKFSLIDNKGIVERTSTMRRIGNWEQATVGGLYRDNLARLMIRETPGKTNWKASGEFSFDGRRYLIEGERLFTRGRVALIDPQYGTAVGYLVYGYMPSTKQVKDFRVGNWSPSDTVFINFAVPKVPAIQQRLLGR